MKLLTSLFLTILLVSPALAEDKDTSALTKEALLKESKQLSDKANNDEVTLKLMELDELTEKDMISPVEMKSHLDGIVAALADGTMSPEETKAWMDRKITPIAPITK